MSKGNEIKDPQFLDDEETEVVEAYERGELVPTDNFPEVKAQMEEAARETLKRRPINIRMVDRDLQRIKALASKEGIPYQTLIQSVLHRYAEGTLRRVD